MISIINNFLTENYFMTLKFISIFYHRSQIQQIQIDAKNTAKRHFINRYLY